MLTDECLRLMIDVMDCNDMLLEAYRYEWSQKIETYSEMVDIAIRNYVSNCS